MDFSARELFVIVLISAVFSTTSSAPAQNQPSAGGPEVLHNIIIELENVLYKLKDYARAVQSASQRESDKNSEIDLSELQAAVLRSQQGASSEAKIKPGASVDVSSANSDVSLREALEYLVALSKQKKVERRDHDIPFPLTGRDNK